MIRIIAVLLAGWCTVAPGRGAEAAQTVILDVKFSADMELKDWPVIEGEWNKPKGLLSFGEEGGAAAPRDQGLELA